MMKNKKAFTISFILFLVLTDFFFADNASSYTLLASKIAGKRKIAVYSNNACNNLSTGFLKDETITYACKRKKSKTFMPVVKRTYINTQKPHIKHTGRKLDVAIIGEGYFKVATKNGPRYTIDGNMLISDQGFLINTRGDIFLDETNKGIIVGEISNIVFGKDGTIVAIRGRQKEVVATLGVFSPTNNLMLKKEGNNLLKNLSGEKKSSNYSIMQQSLNTSNSDISTCANEIKQESQHVVSSEKLLSKIFDTTNKTIYSLSSISN